MSNDSAQVVEAQVIEDCLEVLLKRHVHIQMQYLYGNTPHPYRILQGDGGRLGRGATLLLACQDALLEGDKKRPKYKI